MLFLAAKSEDVVKMLVSSWMLGLMVVSAFTWLDLPHHSSSVDEAVRLLIWRLFGDCQELSEMTAFYVGWWFMKLNGSME